MKYMIKRLIFFVVTICTLVPSVSLAAVSSSQFEISGWIPYWRSAVGVDNILPQLASFTEVNPFMYTVKEDGSLNQASPLTDAEWVNLYTKMHEMNIRFVPTIMWSGPDAMDRILNDPTLRAAHVKAIATEVYTHKLDGIDIDYEAKYASTRDGFSAFLKELNTAIGYDKWIMCTIESRTPLDSRYSSVDSIPKDIEYANDFKEINKYCDRVRIMAYDQNRIDLKLNAANPDPYVPVADIAWVEKVMRVAMQDIAPEKLVIGVPTYGYESDMFNTPTGVMSTGSDAGTTQYSLLWSFNPNYAINTAATLGLTPVRSSWGEMMLTYPASQSPDKTIPLPKATRVMVWSDAVAIQQKIDLAKKLGVRGIALFKIDGGQDPKIFDVLAQYQVVHENIKPTIDGTRGGGSISPEPGSSGGTTSFVIPKRDLKKGSVSEDVRTLQKFLNASGYIVASSGAGSVGHETTTFGPATQGALIRYQKANKISPAVGYFGPITRSVMGKSALASL